MFNQSLRDFIANLEKKGEVIRIKQEVSVVCEVTEIHRRILEVGGPILIFENVLSPEGKSYDIDLLVNLFGTKSRIAYALGIKEEELRDLGALLAFLKQPNPPKKFSEVVSLFPVVKKILASRIKSVKTGSCHEVVLEGEDIDLMKFPIQKCWPNDASQLITWPLIVTKGPNPKDDDTDSYNLGVYRMQLLNKKTSLIRWLKHRGGAQHFVKWKKENNTKFPMAAVIGASPVVTLAAVTPVPDNMSEYQFAGLLSGKRTRLVKCKTIDLEVPEDAEIVIEGYVDISEMEDEGPFGDHTGYYNSVEKFPVFTVTAITHRKNPIYVSTYTSKPPDEPSILGEALNEIFIPIIQQQFPEIVDFYLPPEGCSYRIAIVSIKKSYPGHAKRIMMSVWSYLRQFTYTKFVIIVDDDIDTRNWKEVMWAISTKMDFARDITVIENTPIDYLDFASILPSLGSKIGFDATNKIFPETHREWGELMQMDQDIIDKVTSNWDAYGLSKYKK